MKTIFITLKEYLENGGILLPDPNAIPDGENWGGDLLYTKHISFSSFETDLITIDSIGRFTNFIDLLNIEYCNPFGNFKSIPVADCYVKIEVKPIYKAVNKE